MGIVIYIKRRKVLLLIGPMLFVDVPVVQFLKKHILFLLLTELWEYLSFVPQIV